MDSRKNNSKEVNVLCKDCIHGFIKWRDLPGAWFDKTYYLYCKKAYVEPKIESNPVTGDHLVPAHYQRAHTFRLKFYADHKDRCGPEGKYWLPKHKKDFFVLLKRA